MNSVSNLFKRLSKTQERVLETKLLVNDVEKTDVLVVDYSIEDNLCQNSDFDIGYFTSSVLKIKLYSTDLNSLLNIGDKLTPTIRFKNVNPLVGEDSYSEYMSLGNYYIDSTPVMKDSTLSIIAYDSAIFSDLDYTTALTFPNTMTNVFGEIVTSLGYTLDASVVINPALLIEYYNNTEPLLKREVIGYIAGCHGANAKIGRDGKLKFVKINTTSVELIEPKHIFTYKQLNPTRAISRMVASGETETFIAGSSVESETLYTKNQFYTEANVLNALSVISGTSYLPIDATYTCFPYLEVGDTLSLNKYNGMTWVNQSEIWGTSEEYWDGTVTVNTCILSQTLLFTGGLSCTIVSGGNSEQQNEFTTSGSVTRRLNNLDVNAIKETKVYYGVRINKEDGMVITRNDLLAKAIFNADTIKLQTGNGSGSYTDALYFDAISGKYKFVGDIEASGSITGATIVGGTLNIGSGKFQVALDGTLTATGASISGNISLGTGSSIDWNFVNTDPDTTTALSTANSASSTASSALSVAQQIANGTYSGGTFINGTTIYSPNIYSNTMTIQPISSSSDSQQLNLNAWYDGSLLNVLKISSFASASPFVSFSSSNGAYAYWGFGYTVLNGNLNFENATVSGLDITAKFA